MADGQLGDLLAAVGVPHGRDQLAHLDLAATFGHGFHAGLQTVLNRFHGFIEAQALLEVLLGGPADFAVHHAVVGEVLNELLRHPEQAVVGLHHGNGVVERFQVAHQGSGVR